MVVSHNRAPDQHVFVFSVQGEFLQFYAVPRYTLYIMRALPHVSHPYKGDARHHITMNSGPLSYPAPHAHVARLLDLTLRLVRFLAPRIPLTAASFQNCRIDARNQRSPGAQRNTTMRRLHTCSARYATQMLKPGGRTWSQSHPITAL